jgi:uncharacterized membrane protein YccC
MPKADELLFALKTFSGAMAAFYLALWLGLENPYWAMATAYIVAQPLTGAMRSKALYRFFGTIIGGVAAVAMVPNLVNAPVLLSLALAGWVGLCLYISLLDRSPRAYMFMLAGYTAAIIGFPSVMAPGLVFQTALTRVEEISLGIICTTVVGTVIFPRPLGPVLARRIAGWVQPGIDWAIESLAGQREDAETFMARRRMASEANLIAMMTSQLAYDTSHLQSAVRYITHLRIYVLSLMPVISSIGQRVAQLQRMDGITPALQEVLDATSVWVQAGGPENADAIHARIRGLEETEQSWAGLLRASLTVRLEELVNIMRHVRVIHRHVLDGDIAPKGTLLNAEYIAVATQLRDHGLAMLSGLAAFLAILMVCAFWIGSAWTAGGGAAVIAAIACSFFAAQDDPAPAILRMLRSSVIVTVGAGFYIFVVLPRIETFSELALVLLPVGLVIGILVSRPATFVTGMTIGAFGSTSLALNNGYQGNFAGFMDSSLALVFGIVAALVVTRLIRSVGAAWSATRVLRAGWRDIAAVAEAKGPPDRAIMTGMMMDRLGLLMPRLAAVSQGADIAAADVLDDLRVGLNVIGLQRVFRALPPVAQRDTHSVLAGIAAYYRGNPLVNPPSDLLAAIDKAICAMAPDMVAHREALMMISGLRSVLFGDAPPPALTAWMRSGDKMEQIA